MTVDVSETRIVKGPCLIDIGPNPSHVRAVGAHKKLIKPQRIKVYREKLRFFMRKRDENPIRKWNMISRLQFVGLTLI